LQRKSSIHLFKRSPAVDGSRGLPRGWNQHNRKSAADRLAKSLCCCNIFHWQRFQNDAVSEGDLQLLEKRKPNFLANAMTKSLQNASNEKVNVQRSQQTLQNKLQATEEELRNAKEENQELQKILKGFKPVGGVASLEDMDNPLPVPRGISQADGPALVGHLSYGRNLFGEPTFNPVFYFEDQSF
jgi:hypothetical protein